MNRIIRVIAVLIVPVLMSGVAVAKDHDFNDGLKAYLKGEVEQGIRIWQELAEKGDVRAQKQMAQYYLTDHVHRDYELAIHWYREAASQGDEESVRHLKNVLAVYDTWQGLADELGRNRAYETMTLREHLYEGADTHCGFVIEVRDKVVLLQTATQTRWFRKNDLYPAGLRACNYPQRNPALH